MDPVIVAGGFAVLFALVALMLWRRAADLEEQVRLLEAKLADRTPAKEVAPPEKVPEAAAAEADEEEEEDDEDERAEAEEPAEEDEASDDDDDEAEEEDDEEDDEEEVAAAAPAPPTEEAVAPPAPEPVVEAIEPEPVAAPAPVKAKPEPAAPPKALEPDPLRLAALKIVSDAFELARYLDFDAIVEKPSTYRVTVPITAANGNAVRFLEDKMFTCLSQVRIEDNSAILHIDTGKGPP